MKLTFKYYLLFLTMLFTYLSCSKVSGYGTVTMVMSGSVHGQLDPCG